jgi:hypothetical protein
MTDARAAVLIGEAQIRRGVIKQIGLPDVVRDRHLYIVGKTRMGKSTLITNIALADIKRGAGVCVIDPHGDLVEDLLHSIPKERIRDTIYFDANDREYPIALNVLRAERDEEVALLADNLLVTFRRLSDSWGPRMDEILRATLQTLAQTPGSTFIDIKRILQDQHFRERVTKHITHPMLRDFWQIDFPGYPKDAAQPIHSRVNRFLYAPHFYQMFSTPKTTLTISKVIAEQKVLLVNLASGAIGDDNATLLGSLFVSQIQQAVMRRAALPREARIPYYLFVDEFQNFTNSAFDKILSEAGKYKLCLTLAHQYISQLEEKQREAIFGNVGTMIMFGVGDKDAQSLKNQLGNFEPVDLLNLAPYHALCRPTTAARDTFSFKTLPPPAKGQSNAAAIIKHTRQTYGATFNEPIPHPIEAVPTQEAPPQPPVQTTVPVVVALIPQPLAPAKVKTPADVVPLNLPRKEKVMRYLTQASYLSSRQLVELCFADLSSDGAKKKAVSATTSQLETNKQLGSMIFEREKICYAGKKPNPRSHDLVVRDLFTSIIRSGYAIGEIKFFSQFSDAGMLNPDLAVSFLADDGTDIPTFWEVDMGTEGDAVLLSKIKRYQPYFSTHRIIFVFPDPQRSKKLAGKFPTPLPPIFHTTLDQLRESGGALGGVREPVFGLFSNGDVSRRLGLFE